ncbi:hypothetical protein JW960_24870 [candidate division KSB1 bacterium]|nr:hypothetical protein [candidate division KSB1 bacterium]
MGLNTIVLIIAWLTLALLNAGLAQCKGRRGLLWGLLSLVIGPVASLLLVLQIKVAARKPKPNKFNLEDFREY